jgi:hypothetical protein
MLPRFYLECPLGEGMNTISIYFVMDNLRHWVTFLAPVRSLRNTKPQVASTVVPEARPTTHSSQAKDTSATWSEDYAYKIEAKLLSSKTSGFARLPPKHRVDILSGDRSSRAWKLRLGSIVEERFNGSWVAAGTSGFQKPADFNSSLFKMKRSLLRK